MDEPIFGVYLGDSNRGTDGGEITFGGVVKDYFEGPITWANVVRKGYWEVEMTNVTLDGEDIGVTANRAAIDTGNSLERIFHDSLFIVILKK